MLQSTPRSGDKALSKALLSRPFSLFIVCISLGACATKPEPKYSRLIRRRPYGSDYANNSGYTKDNSGAYAPSSETQRPAKALASQAPLTQAGEYAPIIKSQQYAQVPQEILQLPEIHNQDSYSPSVQEVKFKLVPVTNYPPKGYYPNPSTAYVPDTVIAPGSKEGNPTANIPGQDRIQRRLITVESEGENLTGYARTLGVISREQKAEAEKLLIPAEGEQLVYVNRIGWVALIPKP